MTCALDIKTNFQFPAGLDALHKGEDEITWGFDKEEKLNELGLEGVVILRVESKATCSSVVTPTSLRAEMEVTPPLDSAWPQIQRPG